MVAIFNGRPSVHRVLGAAVDQAAHLGDARRAALVEALVRYAATARQAQARHITLMGTEPIRRAAEIADTTTQRLCSIWAEVLDLEGVDPDDDFFRIGGETYAEANLRRLRGAAVLANHAEWSVPGSNR